MRDQNTTNLNEFSGFRFSNQQYFVITLLVPHFQSSKFLSPLGFVRFIWLVTSLPWLTLKRASVDYFLLSSDCAAVESSYSSFDKSLCLAHMKQASQIRLETVSYSALASSFHISLFSYQGLQVEEVGFSYKMLITK